LARSEPLGALDIPACIEIAGAMEATSRHPIASAFSSSGKTRIDSQRHFPGKGLEASVDGRRCRIGSEGFCGEIAGARPLPAAAGPRSRVFLADERGWLALFELEDELRPDAAQLAASLKQRGIAVHLASGDGAGAVKAVAGRLGIGEFAGGMTPQDKLDYVERLQRAGRVVVMIGDGLNDAPVLARADASVALAGGADAAQLRADVIVLGNSLASILEAFNLARRAMRLVRQNLGWALAYNAAVLPLAAAGWIGPWEAALGMGASSLAVLLNALRPLDRDPKWKASASSYPSRSPSFS
jgi:Cu2+-exporting ATPase